MWAQVKPHGLNQARVASQKESRRLFRERRRILDVRDEMPLKRSPSSFSEVHHSLSFCPVTSETHSELELLAQLALAVLGSWLGGFQE